jgi:hypothetical protein
MGIHSGPVNEVTDLNAQADIAGAGINIAHRVMAIRRRNGWAPGRQEETQALFVRPNKFRTSEQLMETLVVSDWVPHRVDS